MKYTGITGVAALIFGILYTYQAHNLPRASIGNPMAPVYFPFALGVLMILFGVYLTALALKDGEFTELKKRASSFKGFDYTAKTIAVTCAVSIVYARIFNHVGFVLATIFFLGSILFKINGKAQWKTNSLVAIIFSVSVYMLFSRVFGIYLPPMLPRFL